MFDCSEKTKTLLITLLSSESERQRHRSVKICFELDTNVETMSLYFCGAKYSAEAVICGLCPIVVDLLRNWQTAGKGYPLS